jgi:hypothetical protein
MVAGRSDMAEEDTAAGDKEGAAQGEDLLGPFAATWTKVLEAIEVGADALIKKGAAGFDTEQVLKLADALARLSENVEIVEEANKPAPRRGARIRFYPRGPRNT